MHKSPGSLRPIVAHMIIAVMAGCVLWSTGCTAQAKKARHLTRAEEYFQARKFAEAAIEYSNVLKVSPTNQVALRGMGLALCELGDVRAAAPCLLKAKEMDPNDVDVRLKLGTLCLAMGDKSQAREEAESILKRIPENLDALLLWGAGVSTSNEVTTAIARMSGIAAQFEDQPRFHVALASLHAGQGDLAAAEDIYRKALERLPQSWELHLARGDLYLLKHDSTRAGEEYETAAKLSPAKSPARIRLARFLWIGGKDAEAKKILDDLLKQDPRFHAAALCRAEIAVGGHDYDTATKILIGILKASPSNLDSFLLLQRVKLAQGKEDEAIAGYEKLVSVFPQSAQGRYLLGTAWLHKGDIQKAVGECKRAVALDAAHADSVRLLAELYVRLGQPDSSLALLQPFANRHPGDGLAQVLLGTAYDAKKDHARAAETYRQLIKLAPDNPQGHHLLGRTLRRLGKDAEAIAAFEEALRIEPGFPEPLAQMVEILAARNRNWDAAIARIDEQLKKVPTAAGHHYLLGNALLQKRDWDKAEKAFQKAIALKPEITAAHVGLSQLYVATHKEDQALQALDGALSVNSNDVAALMMKGALLTSRNDPTQAAAQYERILATNPSFVPALNNLACLYLTRANMKDKAYELAKRAKDLAPRDSHVADTLGWILFQRGEYKWALTVLQESAASLAKEPEVLFHLGMCQAALGNAENARASLSRAMELAKTFPGSVEAEGMLAVLAAGDELGELADAGQVESFLAKYPDNSFAMTKGGAFYERAGDHERARALYEKALAQNVHFVPALVRLAKLCSGPLNQPDRAMVLAKQAQEEAPGNPNVADALAGVAFQKGDYKWAQSLLVDSLTKAGATPERQYLSGMLQYALGKPEAATNLIAQALSAAPGFPSAEAAKRFMERVRNPEVTMGRMQTEELTRPLTLENLPLLMYAAGTCEQKGEKAGARSLYEQAVARYPDFSPAFRKLALSFTGQKTISDPEFKVLARARELLPDDPDVGLALGRAAYLKGQHEWASRLLKESLASFPDRADVHYFLGLSYHQLKNKDAAQKALTRALELDSRSELAPAAREILGQTP